MLLKKRLMKFTKKDIEIGNKLITDFMGVTVTDLSDEKRNWFRGRCWSPYKESGWSCASSNRDDVERLIYNGKSFHNDWNWLMPVFHKIGKLYIDGFPINTCLGTDGIYIGINPTNASGEEYKGACQIVETLNINYLEMKEPYTPIEAVWLGIVNFLKWYNQHETTT